MILGWEGLENNQYAPQFPLVGEWWSCSSCSAPHQRGWRLQCRQRSHCSVYPSAKQKIAGAQGCSPPDAPFKVHFVLVVFARRVRFLLCRTLFHLLTSGALRWKPGHSLWFLNFNLFSISCVWSLTRSSWSKLCWRDSHPGSLSTPAPAYLDCQIAPLAMKSAAVNPNPVLPLLVLMCVGLSWLFLQETW